MKTLAPQPSTAPRPRHAESPHSSAPRVRRLSPPSTGIPALQRKSSCACGGGCPRCQEQALLQTKLKISEPGDEYEQEADRIADEVMQMPELSVQRQMESDEEEEEEEEAIVQRQATAIQRAPLYSKSESSEVPPIVYEVLQSPGHPLDPTTRIFMESRFSRDFRQVRVHTDAKAAESARAVNAQAYTFKQNIVFAARQYTPTEVAGKKLLAHELTHVIQQGGIPETNSQQTIPQNRKPGIRETSIHPTISRRGPLVRTPVRPVPLPRPPVRAGTGASGGPRTVPGEGVPYHLQYAPPPDWDNSLHALMYHASVARERERVVFQGQIPRATLERGGRAPNFITEGTRESAIGEGYHVSYITRRFHILDAIEYEVSRAVTHEDLVRIVLDYMADTWFGRSVVADIVVARQQPRILYFQNFTISGGLDPEGEQRLRVYATTVAARLQAAPRLRESPLARRFANVLLIEGVREQQGPCRARPVARAGGHARHNEFARHVTGSDLDFQIDTPEGLTCTTDGLDSHGQTWEVKTGYRYFSELGIIWSIEVPRFAELVAMLEEQRARCLYVTARCGYPYAYAFDDRQVADFMRSQWSNLPQVFYIRPPYATSSP